MTERVLEDTDFQCDQNMTTEEFLEWYIERRIQSVGLIWNKPGGAWQGHFVSDNEIRTSTLQTLTQKNRIDEIQVEGIPETFYIPKDIQTYMTGQAPQSYARFIARFEAEPVRQMGEFVIKNWWWEAGIEPDNDMLETIEKEMLRFAEFLQVGNSKNNLSKLR